MLSPPIEGHHIASKRIIESAMRAGTRAHVVTVESDAKPSEAPRNWTIVNSKNTPRDYVPARAVFSAAGEFLASVKIAAHVRSSDCDLVHVLNVTKEPYVITHELMRVKKPLLIHFYHSPYVLTDDIFLIRNAALRIGLYGRVLDNHALTVNMALLKFLVDKLGVSFKRVHYAPFPIDTKTFRPSSDREGLRKKHGFPAACPIIAYVGSLHPARGLSVLIRSFHDVLSRFPQALLHISHPRHKSEKVYETYLHELIQILRLQKSVSITGPSSHVEEVYNLADVVVFPFQRPYWVDPPLALLEAMSSGAAVVTTPVGAISEVVKDREDAVFTKAGNPQILAKTIIELIEDPGELRKIGRKGRETIVKNYSYNVVGSRLSEIYDFILNDLN